MCIYIYIYIYVCVYVYIYIYITIHIIMMIIRRMIMYCERGSRRAREAEIQRVGKEESERASKVGAEERRGGAVELPTQHVLSYNLIHNLRWLV